MSIMILDSLLLILLGCLSPLIIISNLLVLSAWIRFKRLRTPSNILILSLSMSDLGIGLLIPSSVAIDLSTDDKSEENYFYDHENGQNEKGLLLSLSNFTKSSETKISFHSIHFLVLIILCSASLLSVAIIALDRFLSVFSPLRYNHFVTMSHTHRFIISSWAYSITINTISFLLIHENKGLNDEILITIGTIFVYLPCFIFCLISYTYVYIIARSHARAIYSVEISLNQGGLIEVTDTGTTVHHHSTTTIHHFRYGVTLSLLLLTLLFWIPIQVAGLIDTFGGSGILMNPGWRMLLVTPIIISCVLNPWLYAFRSSEIRMAVIRMMDGLACKMTGRPLKHPIFYQNLKTNGDLTSCASNVRLIGLSQSQTTLQCNSPSHPNNNNTHSLSPSNHQLGIGNNDTLLSPLSAASVTTNNNGCKLTSVTNNSTNGNGPRLHNSTECTQNKFNFLLCEYQVSSV